MKGSTIYSYDIAEEATEYGSRHFESVNFINRGIGINETLEEGKFDVILAYEFYPCTRTNDWEYQKAYIQTCVNNLSAHGILLIGLTEKKTCLLENYIQI